MRVIKGALFLCLILVLGFAGFYVADTRGLVPRQFSLPSLASIQLPSAMQLPSSAPNLSDLSMQASTQQLETLATRAQGVASQASQVLGHSIQVNQDSETGVSQRAFDYGRYLYCQQVIKEYESKSTPE